MMSARIRLRVSGRVQGVFYRQSTQEQARTLGLSGWVANQEDGSVLIDAQGERERLESLIIWCRKGPPRANVIDLDVEWIEELDPQISGFHIMR